MQSPENPSGGQERKINFPAFLVLGCICHLQWMLFERKLYFSNVKNNPNYYVKTIYAVSHLAVSEYYGKWERFIITHWHIGSASTIAIFQFTFMHYDCFVFRNNELGSSRSTCALGRRFTCLLNSKLYKAVLTALISMMVLLVKRLNQYSLGLYGYQTLSSILCVSVNVLAHWGRVTHICVSKIIIMGSDNGLSPGRRQAIIWTNAGILLIGPLGTNFSEVLIGIWIFPFKKMHSNMSSAKRRPFCLDLNVLIDMIIYAHIGWYCSYPLPCEIGYDVKHAFFWDATSSPYTGTKISSFWRNFKHWLLWKFSFWQLSVQPMIKISSKWSYFGFSVALERRAKALANAPLFLTRGTK